MTISIITPTLNSGSFITQHITSVKKQNFENIEHIFVDGGSTDDTIDIIRASLSGKDKLIEYPESGIYDAMNKGIEEATGEIVGILNSDDLFFNDSVVRDMEKTFREEESDLLYGDIVFFREDESIFIRRWVSGSFSDFKGGWHPPHPSVYIKRELLKRYGLYDVSLKISSDFDLMLRYFSIPGIRISYFEQFMIKMRYGGASTGSIKNIITGNLNCLKSLKKNDIRVNPIVYMTHRILMKIKQL